MDCKQQRHILLEAVVALVLWGQLLRLEYLVLVGLERLQQLAVLQ
jgi:hypothetical protein